MEAFTEAGHAAARANGWEPWGTEEAWIAVKIAVREMVAGAPPIDPAVKHHLSVLLSRRPQ